jgi:hypothetical protein
VRWSRRKDAEARFRKHTSSRRLSGQLVGENSRREWTVAAPRDRCASPSRIFRSPLNRYDGPTPKQVAQEEGLIRRRACAAGHLVGRRRRRGGGPGWVGFDGGTPAAGGRGRGDWPLGARDLSPPPAGMPAERIDLLQAAEQDLDSRGSAADFAGLSEAAHGRISLAENARTSAATARVAVRRWETLKSLLARFRNGVRSARRLVNRFRASRDELRAAKPRYARRDQLNVSQALMLPVS